MRAFLISIILIFIGISGYSQENESNNKLTRKEKKEIQKLETEKRLKKIYNVLQTKKYLIKFEFVNSLNNQSTNLTPEINFIHINLDQGTLQLSVTEMVEFTDSQVNDLNLQEQIINYSLNEFNSNQEIECRFQIITSNNTPLRIYISVMSNGFSKVIITNEMGVNFTLSGSIEFEDGKPVIPLNTAR